MKSIFTLQLLVVFLTIQQYNCAQTSTSLLDSLEARLLNYKNYDTARVNFLNNAANKILKVDSSRAKLYVQEAQQLSLSLSYTSGVAESNWTMGNITSFYKAHQNALDYYATALCISREQRNKSSELKYLISIINSYKSIGFNDKAFANVELAIDMATELADKKRLAQCLLIRANLYESSGDQDKALEGYEEVLALGEELGDQRFQSFAVNNIGNIFFSKGIFSKAQEFYFKSLSLKETQGDLKGAGISLLNIGTTFFRQDNFTKSLEYYQKALEIGIELNDKRHIARCYSCIGDIYVNSNPQKSLDYYTKAYDIASELSINDIIINSLNGIGGLYFRQGEHTDALSAYRGALAVASKINHQRSMCKINHFIGKVHLADKQYDSAHFHLKNSLALAEKMNLNVERRVCHDLLSKLYFEKKDYKSAYDHKCLYQAYNDSVINDESLRKAVVLEYSYKLDSEKKIIETAQHHKSELLLAESKMQRDIILLLAIGVSVLFIVVVVILRLFVVRRRMNHELIKHKEIIESQNLQLQKYNDGKDRFFGLLAHDLKGSFNSILGFSNLIQDGIGIYNVKELEEMARAIHSSASSTYNLLENLLSWSRSSIGIIEFKPEKFLFSDLVNFCRPQWMGGADAKNVKVDVVFDENVEIYADKDMLCTVMRNLISNAVKYSDRRGKVKVECRVIGDNVELIVSDQGMGMSEDVIESLFDMSKMRSKPGTEKELGTGMGLFLSHEFVKRHQGTISVESNLGRGSRFIVELPLMSEVEIYA